MTEGTLRGVVLVALLGAAGLVLATADVAVGLGVLALFALAWAAAGIADRRRRRRLLEQLEGADRAKKLRAATWNTLDAAVEEASAELARLRAALEQLEPWRERLVASIEGPALVFSGEERLEAANPAACELLGIPTPVPDLPLAQALGSSVIASAVREAAASGRPVQVDAEVRGRQLRATASALAEAILVIIADRTEQRQVEELRRDFVINASHELKTPVTAIQALTDALRVAPPDRHHDLVARLHEESERLSRLVHGLLDLRKIEEGRIDELTSVDLVELVHAAVADVTQQATQRDISFRLELPTQAVIAGSEREVSLIIDNLIANAVQYNEDRGEVTVAVRRVDGCQELTVSDTGVGIPHKAVDRVFERFYRVDVARSRERGGTGLGLSIVRNAVEQHGGRVSVESLLGVGSTFTVRLPIEPPA